MTEIAATAAIESAGAKPKMASEQMPAANEPVSRDIVNLFEHLLGQKVVEPSGPAKDAIANILANPSTLGDHILANVEGMHQTFTDFSTQIEARLSPAGAEGMSLSGGGNSESSGGIHSELSIDTSSAPGPAGEAPVASDGKDAVTPEYGGWQGEMRELLWVQYNVGKILVHEEMMSKAAGKSTRNLDMLLRGQ